MASFSFSSCWPDGALIVCGGVLIIALRAERAELGLAPSCSPNYGVVSAGVVFVEFCRDLDLERACYSDLSATSSRMSSRSFCSSRCYNNCCYCMVRYGDPGDPLLGCCSEPPDPRRLSLAAASSSALSSSSFSLIVLLLLCLTTGFLVLDQSSSGSSGACFPTSIKFLLFSPSIPLFCFKSLALCEFKSLNRSFFYFR